MTRFLIINADDFGYSSEVNAAVIRAYKEGVLTSSSLMTAEPGCSEAVELAKQNPGLGVGLHVVTTYDRAILPHEKVSHVTNGEGKFGADPVRAGMKYSFSRIARKELRDEMQAQFERFAAFGLSWSHVDGHQHFHMHPYVWDTMLDLCDEYGAHRIRIPYEPVIPHLRNGGDGPNLNTAASLALQVMRRRNIRKLRERKTLGGKQVFLCDHVYGQLQTGNMNTDYVIKLLSRLQQGINEIYFHPGSPHARKLPGKAQRDGILDVEMDSLLNENVRQCIISEHLVTGRYEDAENYLRQQL